MREKKARAKYRMNQNIKIINILPVCQMLAIFSLQLPTIHLFFFPRRPDTIGEDWSLYLMWEELRL